MHNEKEDIQEDKRIIINWLAHHNPNRPDFNDHVLYIFNLAICIGCFSFGLGAVLALVFCNIFYFYIINFINLPIILTIFLVCWIPSILQYSIQIMRKKAFRNRKIKFLIRFLYPIGSIILIFKTPFWGLGISIPAGYMIIVIRKIFYKKIKFKNKEN
ncbi:MAG: hypothetical protein ACFE9Q_05105 [Candidatus Hodarchaeota archaeon]